MTKMPGLNNCEASLVGVRYKCPHCGYKGQVRESMMLRRVVSVPFGGDAGRVGERASALRETIGSWGQCPDCRGRVLIRRYMSFQNKYEYAK